MIAQTIWEDGRPGRRFLVEPDEARRVLDTLTEEQLDVLGDACPHDGYSRSAAIRWMHQEAVRRGWLLGPA